MRVLPMSDCDFRKAQKKASHGLRDHYTEDGDLGGLHMVFNGGDFSPEASKQKVVRTPLWGRSRGGLARSVEDLRGPF